MDTFATIAFTVGATLAILVLIDGGIVMARRYKELKKWDI